MVDEVGLVGTELISDAEAAITFDEGDESDASDAVDGVVVVVVTCLFIIIIFLFVCTSLDKISLYNKKWYFILFIYLFISISIYSSIYIYI